MADTSKDADPDPALRHALRLLSMRARTRQELQQALARKEHPAAAIAAALERVQALGYLDDARYARARAESLLREGKMGPQGVTQHLRARGIPAEVVRSALEDAQRALDFDPDAAARALLERRGLYAPGRTLTDKEKGKAARVLAARGFSAAVAERLLGAGAALDSPPEGD
ncbi:MAG TPA: regulatory protein RecX [Myxococcales bacterium]|nr:regulatory protein RecX [Myxococcales bacterium]